jgi:hypothetical protein
MISFTPELPSEPENKNHHRCTRSPRKSFPFEKLGVYLQYLFFKCLVRAIQINVIPRRWIVQ